MFDAVTLIFFFFLVDDVHIIRGSKVSLEKGILNQIFGFIH